MLTKAFFLSNLAASIEKKKIVMALLWDEQKSGTMCTMCCLPDCLDFQGFG